MPISTTRRGFFGLLGASIPLLSIISRQTEAAAEAHPIRYVDPRSISPRFRRQLVSSPYARHGSAIVVDARECLLYLDLGDGSAIRYGVASGRAGQAWSGTAEVGRKARWPAWTPTESMLVNQPGLSYTIDGGPGNPLGARALYLHQGGRDTLYRVHGACDPRFLGRSVSSGCIRLLDQDIVDLYDRVPLGMKVVVL